MKTSSAKQKGKDLENYVADRIVDSGIDVRAKRNADSGSGNREKADIITSMQIGNRNVGIECKNHKVPHIKDWWNQTKKLEDLGREPVLVYKLFGEGLGDAKAVIYFDTLLELISGQSGQVIESALEKPELKWKVKRVIDALNDLKKELI